MLTVCSLKHDSIFGWSQQSPESVLTIELITNVVLSNLIFKLLIYVLDHLRTL